MSALARSRLRWPRPDPERAPRAPSALDDAFPGASLNPRWTQFQTTGLTTEVAGGALSLTGATHAGSRQQGVLQPIPSGGATEWTAVVDVSLEATLNGVNDFAGIGLNAFQDAVANPNTSDFLSVAFAATNNVSQGRYGQIVAERWSQFDTFNASYIGFGGFTDNALSLRLVRTGTTIVFGYSRDGRGFVNIYRLTEPFTPKEIGLLVNNINTGQDVRGVFRNFRFKASADFGPLWAW